MVSKHLALSLLSSNEPDELSQWLNGLPWRQYHNHHHHHHHHLLLLPLLLLLLLLHFPFTEDGGELCYWEQDNIRRENNRENYVRDTSYSVSESTLNDGHRHHAVLSNSA